eukprot:3211564-Rhodomonas_salina.1
MFPTPEIEDTRQHSWYRLCWKCEVFSHWISGIPKLIPSTLSTKMSKTSPFLTPPHLSTRDHGRSLAEPAWDWESSRVSRHREGQRKKHIHLQPFGDVTCSSSDVTCYSGDAKWIQNRDMPQSKPGTWHAQMGT